MLHCVVLAKLYVVPSFTLQRSVGQTSRVSAGTPLALEGWAPAGAR